MSIRGDRSKTRRMPEWGDLLFSDHVVYLGAPMDVDRFVAYTHALVDMHVSYCPGSIQNISGYEESVRKGLDMYSTLQRRNTKTVSILENCLGPVLTDVYMQKMFPLGFNSGGY